MQVNAVGSRTQILMFCIRKGQQKQVPGFCSSSLSLPPSGGGECWEKFQTGAEWQTEHINTRMGTALSLSPSCSLFPALFVSLETFDSDNQEDGEEHLSLFFSL